MNEDEIQLVYTPVPHIESRTIECDVPAFANWLNDIADKVNLHDLRIIKLSEEVAKLRDEVACLDEEVEDLKRRMDEQEACCISNTERIEYLEEQLSGVNNIFQTLDDRIQWFYDKLPTGTGNIPNDWMLALGNINVMSANGGTPSMNTGIFTSMQIENNDVYFY